MIIDTDRLRKQYQAWEKKACQKYDVVENNRATLKGYSRVGKIVSYFENAVTP